MVRTILSLMLAVSLWSSAEAAVLCAHKGPGGNPHGNVTIRETCKSKEIQLDPVTLGVQGPAVYDATGKKVGDIIDLDAGGALILFHLDQYSFLLQVLSNGRFSGEAGGNILYFESTDCTGTPLVLYYHGEFTPVTFVAPPGQTVYIADPQSLPQSVRYHSIFGPDRPCTTVNDLATLVPALALGDLSPLFTPPFSVR